MNQDQHDTARREAIARNLYKKVAELHRKSYEDRCERLARLHTSRYHGDQEVVDSDNTARATERSLRVPREGPGPFRLMLDAAPFGEAVLFVEHWKWTNPAATLTEEFRRKCLAEADTLVPLESTFPKNEFMMRVSENFDYWKQEA